eukprot:COSAG05_NODE_12182_length_479_cov_1.244737_1_plen_122_part_01
MVAALLEKCADPLLRTSKGEQPLHCACEKGHDACVKVLLTAEGVDVNAPGPYKATPLHVASTPSVAELLLDAGADRTLKYRSRDPGAPATHPFLAVLSRMTETVAPTSCTRVHPEFWLLSGC